MNLLPDLFIQNCGQLLTVAGASQRPKILQGMDDLGIILDGAVAIKDGKIIDVGTTRQLEKSITKKVYKLLMRWKRLFCLGLWIVIPTLSLAATVRENSSNARRVRTI